MLEVNEGERVIARGDRSDFGGLSRFHRKIFKSHDRKVRTHQEKCGTLPDWCPEGEGPAILCRYLNDEQFRGPAA